MVLPAVPLMDKPYGPVLIATNRPAQQRRRAALAHQCRSCKRSWALHLVTGPGGQLILCRYCGAPRGARFDEARLDEGLG